MTHTRRVPSQVEFSAESDSERILKIGHHFVKL